MAMENGSFEDVLVPIENGYIFSVANIALPECTLLSPRCFLHVSDLYKEMPFCAAPARQQAIETPGSERHLQMI